MGKIFDILFYKRCSAAALADRAVLRAACVQLQCCCLNTTLCLEL